MTSDTLKQLKFRGAILAAAVFLSFLTFFGTSNYCHFRLGHHHCKGVFLRGIQHISFIGLLVELLAFMGVVSYAFFLVYLKPVLNP